MTWLVPTRPGALCPFHFLSPHDVRQPFSRSSKGGSAPRCRAGPGRLAWNARIGRGRSPRDTTTPILNRQSINQSINLLPSIIFIFLHFFFFLFLSFLSSLFAFLLFSLPFSFFFLSYFHLLGRQPAWPSARGCNKRHFIKLYVYITALQRTWKPD